MLYIVLGVLIGIWLDQTYSIPSVQEYIESSLNKIKEKNAD